MSMNWKIAQSIYNKIISKCPIGTFNNTVVKTPNNYSLRFCLSRATTQTPTMGNKTGGQMRIEEAFKITSKHYDVAKRTNPGSVNKFLNFNTEQERYNAWQSYLTKFARFCVMIDESTKLAPYMGDYTEPWTDKRFKEYFELTDIEWQLIDRIISE